jgi:polo-like kinase 1
LFLNDKLEVKLGDFGLAARLEFDTEKRHTVCGTPNYLAPEVLVSK